MMVLRKIRGYRLLYLDSPLLLPPHFSPLSAHTFCRSCVCERLFLLLPVLRVLSHPLARGVGGVTELEAKWRGIVVVCTSGCVGLPRCCNHPSPPDRSWEPGKFSLGYGHAGIPASKGMSSDCIQRDKETPSGTHMQHRVIPDNGVPSESAVEGALAADPDLQRMENARGRQ